MTFILLYATTKHHLNLVVSDLNKRNIMESTLQLFQNVIFRGLLVLLFYWLGYKVNEVNLLNVNMLTV